MRSAMVVVVAWLWLAGAASAGPVSGVVTTKARTGVAPAVPIVFAEPIDTAAPKQPRRVVMAQKGKSFQPRALAVPTGSTVVFPNDDLIFHNVFALTGPQPFDLGLYRAGESRSRTFTQPASYRVFCNIHPQMSAFLVVVPTPYVATVDAHGRYTVDLPPGRYRITALSERSAAVSVEVTSTPGAVVAATIALDESSYVAVPHLNKHGQPYPAASYPR